MIEKLEIQGFKCFRQFQIDGLRRINLIVGKNGVGKSALLEALRLYLYPDPYCLMDTLAWRDAAHPQASTWNTEWLQQILNQQSGIENPEFILRGNYRVKLRIGRTRLTESTDNWQGKLEPDTAGVTDPNLIRGFSWNVEQRGVDLKTFIRMDDRSPMRPIPHGNWNFDEAMMRGANGKPPLLFVPSGGLSTASAVQLFERVVATDAEDLINGMLRWIVPDAERLLTKGMGAERTLYLKRRGMEAPEPLKRFGDGAARITAIGLAMVNARGGDCLIDEIENGIHFELFDSIWQHVSRMAKDFGVQVFATTHSKDCLNAFGRTFERPEGFDACCFRLEGQGGDIRTVRLDDQGFFSLVRGTAYEVR